MFEAGQIVWAKIKGYPWWPAVLCEQISRIVSSEPIEKDKIGANCDYLVNFIGENTHATLPRKKLCDFQKWFKEFSSQNRNKRLFESIKVACKISSGETSFEHESRKLEFLLINQKEKKNSKKTKAESPSEEDFDFVSNISYKSKSSNNYFKSRLPEINSDQGSNKKVKALSFNEIDEQSLPQLDKLSKMSNSTRKKDPLNSSLNMHNYSKILNETKDSLIRNKNAEENFRKLLESTLRMKELLFSSIENIVHKNGALMEGVFAFTRNNFVENREITEMCDQYRNILDEIKAKFYNEYFDPLILLSNIRAEISKNCTPNESKKKENAAFDYIKETSCETKEHSNCALSEKSDISSQREISELRKKVRMKFEKFIRRKNLMKNEETAQASAEIEHIIYLSAPSSNEYIKSCLVIFKALKKEIIQPNYLLKTKDLKIPSLELKLALSENCLDPQKETRGNSIGVIK